MSGLWWSVVLVCTAPVSVCAAAVAYRMRERARLRLLGESVRLLGRGGRVRYRSLDGQGRATAEWELDIPAEAMGIDIRSRSRRDGGAGDLGG